MSARTLALAAFAVTLVGAVALYAFRPSSASIDADVVRARTPEVDASSAAADPLGNEQDPPTAGGAPADGGDAQDRPPAVVPQPVAPSLTELMLPEVQLPLPLQEAQQTFAAEPVDPEWARAAEARILGEIAALAGRPLISLVAECRSTVCRLQIVERDLASTDAGAPAPNGIPPGVAATANSLRDLFTRIGLEQRGAISVPDPSGTRILLAYLGREGTASPGAAVR